MLNKIRQYSRVINEKYQIEWVKLNSLGYMDNNNKRHSEFRFKLYGKNRSFCIQMLKVSFYNHNIMINDVYNETDFEGFELFLDYIVNFSYRLAYIMPKKIIMNFVIPTFSPYHDRLKNHGFKETININNDRPFRRLIMWRDV